MIARVTCWLALSTCAAIVCAVQLDRQTLDNPELASIVPRLFRGTAQRQLVERALVGKSGADSRRLARELVRRRPLPAHHLSLYAQAAASADDEDGAIAALEVAARRGWREPLPQLAVAQAGLLSGNYGAATERILALVATGAAPREADGLMARLVAEPDGRAALAQAMAGEGHWKPYIVQRLAGIATPEQLADTLRRARQAGARLDCDQLRRVSDSLERQGYAELASGSWPDGCPARDR